MKDNYVLEKQRHLKKNILKKKKKKEAAEEEQKQNNLCLFIELDS